MIAAATAGLNFLSLSLISHQKSPIPLDPHVPSERSAVTLPVSQPGNHLSSVRLRESPQHQVHTQPSGQT